MVSRRFSRRGLVVWLLAALLLCAVLYIGLSWRVAFQSRQQYAEGLVTALHNLAGQLDALAAGDALPPHTAQAAIGLKDQYALATSMLRYQKGFVSAYFGPPDAVWAVMTVLATDLARKEALEERDIAYLCAVSDECEAVYNAFFTEKDGLRVPVRKGITANGMQRLFAGFHARFAAHTGRGDFF